MKVLFVHGFGGENGGRMEDSLRECFRMSKHSFIPFRWKAGNLRSMMLQTGGDILAEALSEINPLRATARVIHTMSQGASTHWDSALANITSAHLALRAKLGTLAKAKEPFAVIAFSLGARGTLLALHTMRENPQTLRRVVFAGAAVPSTAFDMIPLSLRTTKPARIINVYSDADRVLQGLYAVLHSDGYEAAGINAVKSQGVANIKVDAGHLTYPKFAEQLCDLAVGE